MIIRLRNKKKTEMESKVMLIISRVLDNKLLKQHPQQTRHSPIFF